jgi:O-antigen ligase
MAYEVATDTASERCSGFDLICWRLLIWGLGLSTPLLAALKPRRFLVGELDFIDSSAKISKVVTQGFYLFFLALCAVVLLRRLCRVDRDAIPPAVRNFWLFTMLLAAMPTVSNLVAGHPPSFGLFGTLALYSATYLLPAPGLPWCIRELRRMLLVLFVYGSLLAAVLLPHWAWHLEYGVESATAIFPIRLFGTTNHANALAPLAIFAWLLGRFPGGSCSRERLHGAAVLCVLLLTQSKTNWGIALILIGVYGYKNLRVLPRLKRFLVYAASVTLFCSALFYLVALSPFAAGLKEMLSDPQVLTLTGRLPLWIFAIDMWLQQPWLGQGMQGWSSEALLDLVRLLGWAAPHAHNQVLQVLSQSGLIGLGVLALWALSYRALARQSPVEHRVPLYWFTAFFLLPGFTEVILQYGIGPGNTVSTWIVFALTLVLGKKYSAGKAPKRCAEKIPGSPSLPL